MASISWHSRQFSTSIALYRRNETRRFNSTVQYTAKYTSFRYSIFPSHAFGSTKKVVKSESFMDRYRRKWQFISKLLVRQLWVTDLDHLHCLSQHYIYDYNLPIWSTIESIVHISNVTFVSNAKRSRKKNRFAVIASTLKVHFRVIFFWIKLCFAIDGLTDLNTKFAWTL